MPPAFRFHLDFVTQLNMLKHQSTIPVFPSDPLAIQVFEQGDGVFPGQSSQLFEAAHVECFAAPIHQLQAQGLEGIAMDVHLVVPHFDEHPVAEKQGHVPAQVGIGEIEAGGNFGGERRCEPG